MGSNAKKKTTFAKLNREQKMRDRRIEKQARKDARKLAASSAQSVADAAAADARIS
jgi:hypothetical protein